MAWKYALVYHTLPQKERTMVMAYTIGILAAMRSELEPFLNLGFGGGSTGVLAGRPVYNSQAVYTTAEGKSVEVDYQLMVCGVGKVRAASATQALIDSFQPDLVLNVGTAGGLHPDVAVGDIVVTLKQHQHDSQLWERFVCASHPRIAEVMYQQLKKLGLTPVHTGNGCAGDTFQVEVAPKLQLADRYDAYCVDMESAAIGDICALNNVPFCVVRSISDTLHGDANEFEQNYEKVSQLVAEALAMVLPELTVQLDEILGNTLNANKEEGMREDEK